MGHLDDYEFYIESGCTDCSGSLGIQSMPNGYALMLNADYTHYFWMEKATGRESAEDWNKWRIYHGAKADAKKEPT